MLYGNVYLHSHIYITEYDLDRRWNYDHNRLLK